MDIQTQHAWKVDGQGDPVRKSFSKTVWDRMLSIAVRGVTYQKGGWVQLAESMPPPRLDQVVDPIMEEIMPAPEVEAEGPTVIEGDEPITAETQSIDSLPIPMATGEEE